MAEKASLQALGNLLDIMTKLRSADGCPWDREQSPQSLKPYILEETHELLEAIDSGDPKMICDELGDLLLQVVFQAQIFSETDSFTIEDVANSICSKLKRRHPHIFASASYAGHQQRWEEIKHQERSARGQSNLLADRIPSTLPALMRAEKALKRNKEADTYRDIPQVINKLKELRKTLAAPPITTPSAQAEIGQLLLSVTAIAQQLGVNAEDALRRSTDKMIAEIDKPKELL